jgi:ribosome-associated translation inhibitor RaiA
MKIQIRPRGMILTKAQLVRVERDVDLELARFGDRIDRVIVEFKDAGDAGFTSCEIEVRIKPQVVKAEHSDTDVLMAAEHAIKRAARSVNRAIETEVLIRR